MSAKNRAQIRLYERAFVDGLLEGQEHAPRFFWCECVRYKDDIPVSNPKCKLCGGMGYVTSDYDATRTGASEA